MAEEQVKAAANPGQSLKALRLQRGWTLAEVGERTGLPISTLSKIENGKISLTYDKLARISTGLGVDIATLFAAPEAGRRPMEVTYGRRSVTRAGEGRAIETPIYSHLYQASDLLNKRFVPIVVEIRARSLEDFGEMIRHEGEEYAYILEGALDLHTDVYAPLRLETGDSIYFDSAMGHAYVAVGSQPCRVLSICSGEESKLRAAVEAPAQAEPPVAEPAVAKPALLRRRSAAG